MDVKASDVGRYLKLRKRVGKALAAAALASTLVLGDGILASGLLKASGETRSISLYHVHTKESLSITYMQDGRYVPSAMRKINYLLRDWRRDQTVTIDPKTIDLIWEMHADLGSESPISIVCGYRSKRTNAFLKRIGRNVAKHSQHSEGKAIDFYFPDVPTVKIRNLALYRKIGGVGYYRSSGGPSGFLHVDSARVRHWGPRISNSQMVAALSEGRKYSGRRMTNVDSNAMVAENKPSSGGLLAKLFGRKQQPQVAATQPKPEVMPDVNYNAGSSQLALLSKEAVAPPKQAPEPAENLVVASLDTAADDGNNVKQGYPAPLPRQKPMAILAMAAANIRITPVSDEPVDQRALATGQLTKKILEAQSTAQGGKSDFAGQVADLEQKVPSLRMASAGPLSSDELALWKGLLNMNAATLNKAEAPQPETAETREQEINRDGKGSLPRLAFKLDDLLGSTTE